MAAFVFSSAAAEAPVISAHFCHTRLGSQAVEVDFLSEERAPRPKPILFSPIKHLYFLS